MYLRLLLASIFPLLAAAQTISFLPPTLVVSGGAHVVSDCSGCVAIADFNHDGKLDFAFNVETPLPYTGVSLGNGDGTFQPPLQLYSAQGPMLVGDFNGDGIPDLVFASYTTAVYLGKGDGTFSNPISVGACAAPTSYVSVQVGDFNGDGKTDILCATALLFSNGDGTFRSGGSVRTVPMEAVELVADFNHDGISDVLLRQLSGHLAVVLGRPDGAFGSELPLNYTVPPQQDTPFLAGDFNADGKLDLIVYSIRGDTINFLPGNGDGTFGTPLSTGISAFPQPLPLTAIGDFNHDRKLDLLAGNSIYPGNGDGTFLPPTFFGPTADPCGPALSTIISYSCNYSHGSTAVGDFNGDGLPDLAAYVVTKLETGQISDRGEVNVLLNDSPGNGFKTAGVSSATGIWPVGPGSITTAYGTDLAPATASASTNPAPTTLGGIRLHVRDRSHTADALAPLLYVSPTQINYVLNSSDPYAWVSIERVGAPYVPQGITVPIAPLAPGFFAAAYTTNAPGYLSLYGTGFAQAFASASTCTVGNLNVAVTYAGPQIQMAGLDQVNLFLPASLAGAGLQPVACIFQTAQQVYGFSNTVNVTIR